MVGRRTGARMDIAGIRPLRNREIGSRRTLAVADARSVGVVDAVFAEVRSVPRNRVMVSVVVPDGQAMMSGVDPDRRTRQHREVGQ